MSNSFHQLASRSAGESFFSALCARQLDFAGHARRCFMRLRATLSPAFRSVAGVGFAGAALTYAPGFAATRGFGRHLRVTNLPERVGAQPGLLRSARVLGLRCSARVQTRRVSRSFVGSVAAMRGGLSRALRLGVGLLVHASGFSTKCSGRRFRSGRVSCGAAFSPITLPRQLNVEKRRTMALQRTGSPLRFASRLAWKLGSCLCSDARLPGEPVSELESFGVYARVP